MICSFCGRSRLSGETIVAGPDVAICASCAYISMNAIAAAADEPLPEGETEVSMAVFEDPACLMPSRRASLAADLATVAADNDARLAAWSYHCSTASGDHLYVRLSCKNELPAEQVLCGFISGFLKG